MVDAVSDAHVAGPDHEWSLDLPDEPVLVVGDEARLHQVLANLLANARMHTPRGHDGHDVAGDRWRRCGGTDRGRRRAGHPGRVAARGLRTVRARRLVALARAAAARGSGLAIVAAVVKAHHGTIDVRSAPGRTEFVVTLPASSQATHSAVKSGA